MKSINEYFNESGHRQENKWTFLVEGKKAEIPVSPYMTDLEYLVCKNINIEGGMGIHFYKVCKFSL